MGAKPNPSSPSVGSSQPSHSPHSAFRFALAAEVFCIFVRVRIAVGVEHNLRRIFGFIPGMDNATAVVGVDEDDDVFEPEMFGTPTGAPARRGPRRLKTPCALLSVWQFLALTPKGP